MYQAILFDLDDTLYDLQTHRAGQIRLALADVTRHYPHLDVDQLVRAGVSERIFIAQFGDLLRRSGVEDEAIIAEAQRGMRERWFEQLELAEDAASTLEVLRQRYRIGLITNGPSWTQRVKIERFGLEQRMDLVIVSEEAGVAKPDPAIFQLALDQLEVTAEQTLFVGDSPENDLAGAAAVGMRAVWLNRHGMALPPQVPPPIATLQRLSDLLPLLDAV